MNYVLVFNGEIYNYVELKVALQSKHHFRTQSDTEVLLNAYIEWGERCLDKCNGMFSFAIWNKSEQVLFAAQKLGWKCEVSRQWNTYYCVCNIYTL